MIKHNGPQRQEREIKKRQEVTTTTAAQIRDKKKTRTGRSGIILSGKRREQVP